MVKKDYIERMEDEERMKIVEKVYKMKEGI